MSVPPTPTRGSSPSQNGSRQHFIPLVSVVDFHHARGPEVEKWFGVEEGRDPAVEYDWGLLPFMALSDGAHALTEDFSYFTLLRPATEAAPATSLFGISCTRQMDASQLLNRPADVTRSTVQKAVVVIADSPQYFGMLRERLSVVTKAWFAQREFTDTEILKRFQESLADEKERGMMNEDEDRDQYLGLSLREMVREFKWQTLVLLKCCLLQPKMLFFGTRCERLCLTQFSLVSLIPGLLRNLQDSAGPELDNYEKNLQQPTSLRTSDRNSLLAYMGLPLQIFGKGSLYGPYTPLQQLDILADFGTKSYIVGSTNSLLLQQKDRYSDILINLDEGTINITSSSLKAALQLSTPDRRWIDFITQNVNDTWDEANPGRPKTMGYVGSEEFIRVQFEEYLLSLISAVKYHNHLAKYANNSKMLLPHIEGDPSHDFGQDFVEAWSRTENYRIWNSHTDSHLFDIVEPKHPCAGGLTIEDVQRRITQQVQDMHWDDRFTQGKEALGSKLAAGKEKASSIFNKLYADMEAMREAQRKKAEEVRREAELQEKAEKEKEKNGAAEAQQAQQQQSQSVGSKAGAFVNSWASWAGEKRRKAWGGGSDNGATATPNNGPGGGSGGGWTSGWGKSKSNRNSQMSTSSGDAMLFSADKEGRASISSARTVPVGGTSYSRLPLSGGDDDGGDSERRPLNRSSVVSVASSRTTTTTTTGESESVVSSPPRRRFPVRPLSAESIPELASEGGNIDAVVGDGDKEKEGGMSGGGQNEKKKKTVDDEEEEGDNEGGGGPTPKTPLPISVAADEAAKVQSVWDSDR